jgi:tetratricopeptide (TPR) repeat protein
MIAGMMTGRLRAALHWSLIATTLALAGCASDLIKANQDQLAQQQVQLDQLKQQVAALQALDAAGRVVPVAPGACDESVMREASRKGGERFAASDFPQALAYYQDAVSACPRNSRAQLNLARAYESLGDTAQARAHYQLAADASGDVTAAKEARDALARPRP